MKKPSQKDFVVSELKREGRISRNYCLHLYDLKIRPNILRLSDIIHKLNLDGWNIEGKDVETDTGADFVYTVVGSPFKKVVYTVPSTGQQIIRFEKQT